MHGHSYALVFITLLAYLIGEHFGANSLAQALSLTQEHPRSATDMVTTSYSQPTGGDCIVHDPAGNAYNISNIPITTLDNVPDSSGINVTLIVSLCTPQAITPYDYSPCSTPYLIGIWDNSNHLCADKYVRSSDTRFWWSFSFNGGNPAAYATFEGNAHFRVMLTCGSEPLALAKINFHDSVAFTSSELCLPTTMAPPTPPTPLPPPSPAPPTPLPPVPPAPPAPASQICGPNTLLSLLFSSPETCSQFASDPPIVSPDASAYGNCTFSAYCITNFTQVVISPAASGVSNGIIGLASPGLAAFSVTFAENAYCGKSANEVSWGYNCDFPSVCKSNSTISFNEGATCCGFAMGTEMIITLTADVGPNCGLWMPRN